MEKKSIRHKAMLITINKTYEEAKTNPQKLYEVTRGVWRVNKKRAQNADFAMAVYKGIVREVYSIVSWHPAGITEYKYRPESIAFKDKYPERSEFQGFVANDDIRGEYINQWVGPSGGNPIRYENC